jgi:hypothetical protein
VDYAWALPGDVGGDGGSGDGGFDDVSDDVDALSENAWNDFIGEGLTFIESLSATAGLSPGGGASGARVLAIGNVDVFCPADRRIDRSIHSAGLYSALNSPRPHVTSLAGLGNLRVERLELRRAHDAAEQPGAQPEPPQEACGKLT